MQDKICFYSEIQVDESTGLTDGTKLVMTDDLPTLAKLVSTVMYHNEDVRDVICAAVAIYISKAGDPCAMEAIQNTVDHLNSLP